MNLHISATAVQPLASLNNMANVIDSLKRLERIGSEESQTVQKILEAAKELSQAICEHFPRSLRHQTITGFVNSDGEVRLGAWSSVSRKAQEEGKPPRVVANPRPRHQFGNYVVSSSSNAGILALQRDDEERFVGFDRETALIFSKDIANGLLEVINQFIEAEHRMSTEGLGLLASAADSLKSLSKTSDQE